MKKLLFLLLALSISLSSATLEGDEVLQLHSGTTAEMNAVTSPKKGHVILNTDTNTIWHYNGTSWIDGKIVNVIGAEADNQIEAGANGGAYLGPTVYTGFFIINASGNKIIMGLPFQPSQITFVAHANVESLNIDSDNGTGNNDRGIDNSFGTMNGFARDDSGTTTQQVIYVGSHGNSVNDISRYASSSNCIGVRYGDQDGNDLGKITASFTSFDTNGFTVNVTYVNGTVTVNHVDPLRDVQPTDILNENLVVLYTAYK